MTNPFFVSCRGALVLLCVALLTVSGCAYIKAGPAEDSGFLRDAEAMEENDLYPFHASWEREYIDDSKYDSLYIADVNIEFLKLTSDWSRIEVLSEEEMVDEATGLASYFKSKLISQFKEKGANLVDKPRPRTVVLEIAIIELVPTDVVRNAVGTVVGFFVPGAGLVSAGAGGSIAIEGRYVDYATGEILARFKDREKPKIAPVDLAGLSALHHATVSIDDWIEQITEIILEPKGTPVADSLPFTFRPW